MSADSSRRILLVGGDRLADATGRAVEPEVRASSAS